MAVTDLESTSTSITHVESHFQVSPEDDNLTTDEKTALINIAKDLIIQAGGTVLADRTVGQNYKYLLFTIPAGIQFPIKKEDKRFWICYWGKIAAKLPVGWDRDIMFTPD